MGDSLPAVDLGAGRIAVSLAAGAGHTCALLDDGSVKCWGQSLHGELGSGNKTSRGIGPHEMGDELPNIDFGTNRFAVSISAGQDHTCAVLDDGSVRCWGLNDHGQLGLGDTDDRGDDPGEMGDALPSVDLGENRVVLALQAGAYHNCAVLDDEALKCWGHNNVGQLGLEDEIARGDNPGEMGDALPAVDLGKSEAVSSLSSSYANCVVFDDGLMKCFGYNFDGQLGLGDVMTRGNDPGEMGEALPIVDVGPGRTVTSVALAVFHTCALRDDASVTCWGYNGLGQLGIGNYSDRLSVEANSPPIELW
jgi:alpha-tubulin suppressor-like RCC1 family protein